MSDPVCRLDEQRWLKQSLYRAIEIKRLLKHFSLRMLSRTKITPEEEVDYVIEAADPEGKLGAKHIWAKAFQEGIHISQCVRSWMGPIQRD